MKINSLHRVLPVDACTLFGLPARAAEPGLPPGFKTQTVASPAGAEVYVRSGGSGPAVGLLHGFGDTGDRWGPLAVELTKDHTVIMSDLGGLGHSSRPGTATKR